jgi:hypothetical protein
MGPAWAVTVTGSAEDIDAVDSHVRSQLTAQDD